jgi:Flp pilus assembly protein TadD
VALKLERYEEALKALEMAVQVADDSENEQLRGAALASLGRVEEAVKAYRAAIELDPQNEEARRELALLERRLAPSN